VDGPRDSSGEPPAPGLAWIDTEEGPGRRGPGRRPLLLGVLAAVMLVAAVVAWELTRTPDWPSGCPVSGHADWCSDPSEAITDPALVDLARSYCPALSRVDEGDVVPQPLSELGLADERTFAKTTGDPESGSEDALLGTPGAVAWVTRWQDGQVQVRCAGSSATTPSLRLRADQFRSTVAAGGAPDRPHVAFTDVARDMAEGYSTDPRTDTSYGFVSCDTDAIDLELPEVGETFSCVVEVYGLEGEGRHRESYRIAADRPFFEPLR